MKLALNAGHYSGTSKGIPANFSTTKKFVNEWYLNDRICDKVETLLAGYDGIELLRIDDTTGKVDIELEDRTDKANNWNADFYLAVHHNAGIGGGSGGGIMAYTYTSVGAETVAWQKDLYNALIEHTGLKGNRSQPLATANLHECRETKMPAVLLELGFMDSTIDAPIIQTEGFANKCAKAIVEVIVKRGKLTKKPEPAADKLYRVQAGAFRSRENAEAYAEKLKADGYDAFVVEVEA